MTDRAVVRVCAVQRLDASPRWWSSNTAAVHSHTALKATTVTVDGASGNQRELRPRAPSVAAATTAPRSPAAQAAGGRHARRGGCSTRSPCDDRSDGQAYTTSPSTDPTHRECLLSAGTRPRPSPGGRHPRWPPRPAAGQRPPLPLTELHERAIEGRYPHRGSDGDLITCRRAAQALPARPQRERSDGIPHAARRRLSNREANRPRPPSCDRPMPAPASTPLIQQRCDNTRCRAACRQDHTTTAARPDRFAVGPRA